MQDSHSLTESLSALGSDSPFEIGTQVSSILEMASGAATKKHIPTDFILRTQSSHFHDDNTILSVDDINRLLLRDVHDRIMEVGDGIAAELFPDETFGFPINDQFVKNFCGSIISTSKLFDSANFKNEVATATFLNRMITTVGKFLSSTKKTSLEPLRHFTSVHSTSPLPGARLKPDIVVVPLADGCIRKEGLSWKDVHALVEHTQEKRPPDRMSKTVRCKTYITFCHQPERDFIPFVCITKDGFHIIVTDHTGQIETDVIPFDRCSRNLGGQVM